MEAKLPIAFVAGLLSFATPCVLPLVPGYLSAVSGGTGDHASRTGRRVVVGSVPFVLGFSLLFVALGAAAGGAGGLAGDDRQLVRHVAGVVIVILGLAFLGLLPMPWLDRLAASAVLGRLQSTGSRLALGASFGLCAAPCIGPVLGSILSLAGDESTVAQGAALLFVYSLGLALPFLAVGVGFGRAVGAFRWLRDRYGWVKALSGSVLIGVGLLLFFDRFWWLRVAVNRTLEFFGIGV